VQKNTGGGWVDAGPGRARWHSDYISRESWSNHPALEDGDIPNIGHSKMRPRFDQPDWPFKLTEADYAAIEKDQPTCPRCGLAVYYGDNLECRNCSEKQPTG